MIATDRVSAFDVILHEGIPGKGIILTQMSLFWFDYLKDVVPNHIVPNHNKRLLAVLADYPELYKRSMIVKKLKPLPIESIVRGYLAGNAWRNYQDTDRLWDMELPNGMKEFDALPEPAVTPTTKAKKGHDEPLYHEQAADLLGEDLFSQVKEKSIALFKNASQRIEESHFILADAKMEFGVDEANQLYLIDEAFTPDSSRFWLKKDYETSNLPTGFDKQIIRNYLLSLGWSTKPPIPSLPLDIITQTQIRYMEVFEHIVYRPSFT